MDQGQSWECAAHFEAMPCLYVMRRHLLIRGWMGRRAAITSHMFAIALLSVSPLAAQDAGRRTAASAQPCVGDNGGITLPPGLCATVFADNIGHSEGDNWAPPMGGIERRTSAGCGTPTLMLRYADIN